MADATPVASPSDTQAQQTNQNLGKIVDALNTQSTSLITALNAVLTAVQS